MSSIIKEYDAKLDDKKRFTIRGTRFDYYKVKEFDDGRIELEPRLLASTDSISEKSLKMMDISVKNFKNNQVSPVIDLKKYK